MKMLGVWGVLGVWGRGVVVGKGGLGEGGMVVWGVWVVRLTEFINCGGHGGSHGCMSIIRERL